MEYNFGVSVDGFDLVAHLAVQCDDVDNAHEDFISIFRFANADVYTGAEFIDSNDNVGVATIGRNLELVDV